MLEGRVNANSELYKIEDGEPANIKKQVWNGELSAYMLQLVNKIHLDKNFKTRENNLLELARCVNHFNNEFAKAEFYRQEWESMANYLDSLDIISKTKHYGTHTDSKGKDIIFIAKECRSITKSIPELRALVS